ncbi:MAG: hypothetical protein LBT44_09330 [Clostridiales bacterium]|jgi:hypothetical protein|nr:hypothetical protein [Clostridiales bacterium]
MQKKPIIISAYLIGAFCLAACSGKPSPSPPPSPDPVQEAVIMPSGDYENPFIPPEGFEGKFSLTEQQQQLFDEYSKDFRFDVSAFKDASPVDIAQVFIQCGIEGYWEGEYNLYSFESTDAVISKEDFKKESDEDMLLTDLRTRSDYANIAFAGLKDGKFADNGDSTGWIEFTAYETSFEDTALISIEKKMHFHLNDEGIWLVRFHPFDE